MPSPRDERERLLAERSALRARLRALDLALDAGLETPAAFPYPVPEHPLLGDNSGFLRVIFDQAAIGISQVAPDGRFLAANDKFCSLLATERGELLELRFQDLTHPEDLPAALDLTRRQLAGELTSYTLEKRYLRKDGQPVWVSLSSSLVRCPASQPLYRINLVQDITERKRAEEQLRQSEERFRQLAENSAEVFWITSADGYELEYVSPAYERIWGRTCQSLLARPLSWLDDIHADDRARVARAFADKASRGDYHEEYRIVRPDGGVRWVRDRGFPIRDGAGQVFRIAGIAEDITQRREAEAERQRLEAQLQHAQKLESLGVLAGGIAHDFNNLLTGILGNVSLAQADVPEDSPACFPLQQVETAALRAADLTRQMLAYSGKGRFQIQALDLSRLVEEMANLLLTVISKKALLRFDFTPGLPAVQGDATQLRQVVMNLLTNASDALGERGGTITIRTGVLHADQRFLASTYIKGDLPEGPYVYAEVSDTGCGMDEATLARIFEPFFTTKFVGRGLGLAAVLGIVRGHRGTIAVTSEPTRGTTFKVLFPAVAPTNDCPPPAGAQAAAPWHGSGTVLVIDDEETVRNVAEPILVKAGFRPLLAADGRAGLMAFHAHRADIVAVLLDLTMPDLNGAEVFRELRLLHPDVRVLLMSGYNEQEVVTLFAGKGLAGFVQKPFRAGDLIAALRQALQA